MDELHIAGGDLGDNADMPDALTPRAVAFEKDQVAGFGIAQLHRLAVLGLCGAGMRKGDVPMNNTVQSRSNRNLFWMNRRNGKGYSDAGSRS